MQVLICPLCGMKARNRARRPSERQLEVAPLLQDDPCRPTATAADLTTRATTAVLAMQQFHVDRSSSDTPSSERQANRSAAACMPSKTASASGAGKPLGS